MLPLQIVSAIEAQFGMKVKNHKECFELTFYINRLTHSNFTTDRIKELIGLKKAMSHRKYLNWIQ